MTDLDDLVDEWHLRPDGDASHGTVLPVRSDGVPAVLKVGGAEHAHLVLRRWNGDGAARLLRADPHRRAVLLERLQPRTLETVRDLDACEIVAGLYRRLHVPAMPRLPSLSTLLGYWAGEFRRLPRNAPVPHRLVEQAATLCDDLAAVPADTVLHGDLQYAHVLAAARDPWLAVSPAPLNGHPAYEIGPMLWHRWDELSGTVRFGVQQRFYTLVDTAGLDEDDARAWTIVRIVREAVRALDDAEALTRFVTLAKAIQD